MSDLIACPHCGRVIDLDDPRLRRLTPTTFAVFVRLKRELHRGQVVGVTEAAKILAVAPQTANYHLKKLRADGLIRAIPKREGGTYNVYRLAA